MCEVADEASIIQRLGGRTCNEITTVDPHHDGQGAPHRDAEVHVQRNEDVEVQTVLADLCLETLEEMLNICLLKKESIFSHLGVFLYPWCVGVVGV